MKKLMYIGSALLVSVLVACGSQVVDFPEVQAVDAPPTDTLPANEQCVDANCPLGQVCQNNVCTQVDPCNGVACPDGTVCREGACAAVDPCAGTTCPEGSVCKDGVCTLTDPCAGVVCPEGAQCVNGACVAPETDAGTPETDSGLPETDAGTPEVDSGSLDTGLPTDPCAGVVCDAGTCVNGQCVSTDPCAGMTCPENTTCYNGTCTPNDPCAGVSCCKGKVCKDGACVRVDPCEGVVCPESRVCKNGACVCAGENPSIKHDAGNDDKECREGKTLICHKAGPHGKKLNLCVGNPAVPAHVKHGDKVGDCSVCH